MISERNYERLVREGILAARSGNHALAAALLQKALSQNPADSRAWLWLTETTDDPLEKKQYLEKAVAADPANAAARRGLAILTGQLEAGQVLPSGHDGQQLEAEPGESRSGHTFSCPSCSGPLEFDPQRENLVCDYCGNRVSTDGATQAAGSEGRPLDLILPTARGHHWTEAQFHFECRRCGAVVLHEAEQLSEQCAYCGSNHLVQAARKAELIDPEAIILAQVDESTARKKVAAWLREGSPAPNELNLAIRRMTLRMAYYPFWIFEGTLEIPWSCEIWEGLGDAGYWAPRSGAEYRMFRNVLVPGLRGFLPREILEVGAFELDDLAEFKPDHLAGWHAMTYTRSVADASLLAREMVIKGFRRQLAGKVEPGRRKQHLQFGAGRWSGLTYRLALLPIWVGSYQFQSKAYRVLVNGQTGHVGGQKPDDRLRVAFLWATGAIVAIILALIAVMLLMAYGDQLSLVLESFL